MYFKSHRINLIHNKRAFNADGSFSDFTMCMYLLGYLAIWTVLLTVWNVLPVYRPQVYTTTTPNYSPSGSITSFTTTTQCDYGQFKYGQDISFFLFYFANVSIAMLALERWLYRLSWDYFLHMLFVTLPIRSMKVVGLLLQSTIMLFSQSLL